MSRRLAVANARRLAVCFLLPKQKGEYMTADDSVKYRRIRIHVCPGCILAVFSSTGRPRANQKAGGTMQTNMYQARLSPCVRCGHAILVNRDEH